MMPRRMRSFAPSTLDAANVPASPVTLPMKLRRDCMEEQTPFAPDSVWGGKYNYIRCGGEGGWGSGERRARREGFTLDGVDHVRRLIARATALAGLGAPRPLPSS